MNYAKCSIKNKRKVVIKYMDIDLFPYTKRYLGTLSKRLMWMGLTKYAEIILMIKTALLINMAYV